MARSRAQQAAIAIAMKKAGKKPKSLKKANKGLSVEKGCPPNCNTTADSTTYYDRLSKSYFDKAKSVRNAPYDGRLLSEQWKERTAKEKEYTNKAFKAIDDQLRQSRKGKPGYDKNGFPIKKTTTKKKG